MNKYQHEVRVSFFGAMTQVVNTMSKEEAILAVKDEIGGWLDNVNVDFDDCEIQVRKLGWRDDEDYANLAKTYGEPSYEFDGKPVWVLKEDSGIILYYGDLIAFTVDQKNRIFDIWTDGHFVDHGSDYYIAYANYIAEQELLK